MLGLILGVPRVAAILWLMARAGQLWWLWAWLLWMTFSLFITWAYPIWIAPLFNRFKSLDDAALRARLRTSLQRCGFTNNGMYVMDGSLTLGTSAMPYFTGFGANKRIVFFDTLAPTARRADEVEAVLAPRAGQFQTSPLVKMLAFPRRCRFWDWRCRWLAGQYGSTCRVWCHPTAMRPHWYCSCWWLCSPLFANPLLYRRAATNSRQTTSLRSTDRPDLISGPVKMYRDNVSNADARSFCTCVSPQPPAGTRAHRQPVI